MLHLGNRTGGSFILSQIQHEQENGTRMVWESYQNTLGLLCYTFWVGVATGAPSHTHLHSVWRGCEDAHNEDS